MTRLLDSTSNELPPLRVSFTSPSHYLVFVDEIEKKLE